MILFVDLETTGLDALVRTESGANTFKARDRVLEIAAILTDDRLNEVARFQSVTTEARKVLLDDVDPFVRAMHAKNGLWIESILAPESDIYVFGYTDASGVKHPPVIQNNTACALNEVAPRFGKWLLEHMELDAFGQPKYKIVLGGNTPSFDRTFLETYFVADRLNNVVQYLSHRHFDVSSLNELVKRFRPEIFEARPKLDESKAHRAMNDIENSVDVARYYARALGLQPEATTDAPSEVAP